MIDYGEEKQTFGAPEIKVGPISQLLTALYVGIFLFAFFMPEMAKTLLPQVNADLPGKFWTLLTGIFIFPESAGVYTKVPAGFWVVVTFLMIFFVVRPLEERALRKWSFGAFLLTFMLGPALILWGIAPRGIDPAGTWPFWFAASSMWAYWKFRTMTVKVGDKLLKRKWIFLALALVPLIRSVCLAQWSRTALYAGCILLGALWGVVEERIQKK